MTHDQEEALGLSDRIAVFNDGRIEQVGSGEELYERPRTRFVAEFLGESNVFAGTLGRSGRDRVLVVDHHELVVSESALADGEPAAIVVRPDHVAVVRDGAVASGHNVLAGTVREVIYLGTARKLEVEMPDGRTMIVREPADVPAAVTRGDDVRLSWDPHSAALVAA